MPRSRTHVRLPSAALAATLFAAGCASPGPPRAPSLQLPERVSTLQAARTGPAVTIRFQVPSTTSDGQPLRRPVTAVLCRSVPPAPCEPPPAFAAPVPVTGAVEWTDTLPPPLASGPPRQLTYRVELFNPGHRSAGWSDPADTLAGAAPDPVANFRISATAAGVALHWDPTPNPGPGEDIIIERRLLSAPPAPDASSATPRRNPHTSPIPAAITHLGATPSGPKSPTVWLHAAPGSTPAPGLLDASATPDATFLYTAFRRRSVQVAPGLHLEMRSQPSPAGAFTFRDDFPPPRPSGLLGAPFTSAEGASPAVDLNWQPSISPDLAGYLVYRERLAPPDPAEKPQKLTSSPVPLPTFHDAFPGTTPARGMRYRYRVTAIDVRGNESQPSEPADITIP